MTTRTNFVAELEGRILREQDHALPTRKRVEQNRLKWLRISGGFGAGPRAVNSATWAKLRLEHIVAVDRYRVTVRYLNREATTS